ncbi:MAG: type II secretion system protein J [Vulcanimicrobiota bacterium]
MRRGFTLAEIGVTTAIFSLFLILFIVVMRSSSQLSQGISSEQDNVFALQKARGSVESDLRETSFSQLKTKVVTKLGQDIPAVWFLSAYDQVDGRFRTQDDGTPQWNTNILYYLAAPKKHDQLFGQTCDGYDARCPHKFLVRRVIRKRPWEEAPDLPRPEEKLVPDANIDHWVVVPEDYSLGFPELGTAPAYVMESRLVASGLLTFEVHLGPDPTWPNEVEVVCSAFSKEKAGQGVAVGSVSLIDSEWTDHLVFSVFPVH